MPNINFLRIVAASPNDVRAEREVLNEIVENLNRGIAAEKGLRLELDTWERRIHSTFHVGGFQGLINEVLKIESCDILICIFWKRFGTPVQNAQSGTQSEFEAAYETWLKRGTPKIMVYFSQAPYVLQTPDDARQLENVLQFKEQLPRECIPQDYRSPDHFRDLVRDDLTKVVLGADIFKASNFAMEVTVEPLGDVDHIVKYGGVFTANRKESTIRTDNKAHIRRTVTFSKDNECYDYFDLSYRTKNAGFVDVSDETRKEIRERHEFTPLTRRLETAYDDHGREILYHFRPRRGETYTLDIIVYKGFDQGHQSLRVICPRRTWCKEFSFKVDLNAFKPDQFEISAPELFLYSDKDYKPESGELIPHTSCSSQGIWEWDITSRPVDRLYVKWNVAKVNDQRMAATSGK